MLAFNCDFSDGGWHEKCFCGQMVSSGTKGDCFRLIQGAYAAPDVSFQFQFGETTIDTNDIVQES